MHKNHAQCAFTLTIHPVKLASSMTLFGKADPENPIYHQLLDKFYAGKADEKTLNLLNKTEGFF